MNSLAGTTREGLIAELRGRFGERVTTSRAAREQHGHGEALREPMPPDAVVFPATTSEVAEILEACNAAGVPVIPYGAGTSLEGQVQAPAGGICLDMSLMAGVLETSQDDLDCRVQAGVTREALNRHLRADGLFFPIDPGADATLGGMAATRASGTNAVRYGTMRDLVLGLTVVTPAGRIIRTGTRARKSASGYDLTRLYVGSEGTLGVITELQLRLFGIPEQIGSAVCPFADVESAVAAVIAILQHGIGVARIELLDEVQMRASIAYSRLEGLAPSPALFLEFHGSPACVAEEVRQVREIASANGGGDFQWAETAEDRSRLWKARHDAYWAARSTAPGREAFATDVCVPISKLSAAIVGAKAEARSTGYDCPILGHVGDGNFHMLVFYDPEKPAERERAEALGFSLGRLALGNGGTCTGEHGIGLHKLPLMAEEHGEALGVMRLVKQALDPNGIMNPGKLLPPQTPEQETGASYSWAGESR